MTRLFKAFATLPLLLACLLGLPVNAAENLDSTQSSIKTGEAPIPQAGGYSNISNALLQQMIDDGVAVIDIRRQEEWRETGVIEGSKPITFFLGNGELNPNFVTEFTAAVDANQPVALICRTGGRTQVASSAIVKHLGYQQVFNVTNGIKSWISEKRPVVPYQ